MAATYEPIASVTLGSDTTDVTFSSIPGTYTDLRLVTSIIASSAGAIDVDYRFNGDTSTNYSWTILYGNGSSAASARVSSVNYLRLGYSPGSASSTWSVGQVDVFSYANTNVYKTSLVSNAAPANFVQRQVGLWRSTSAITSLTVVGAFKAGSTFSLFGIKAKSPVLPILIEGTKTTSSVSATIYNYDAGLTYTLDSTAGTASISGDTITVSGLTQGQNITLTVTATNGANSSSSNSISLTSEVPLPTGGTITTSGSYRIHSFTSSGTFEVFEDKNVEYLIVAGGGGGAGNNDSSYYVYSYGGGGAGGYTQSSFTSLPTGSYSISVGAGGAGSSYYGSNGVSGSSSSFHTVTNTGGGGGGRGTGAAGGSGGGGGTQGPFDSPGGNGISGQGYKGGSSYYGSSNANYWAGGGGGGSSSAGVNGGSSYGGNGGAGTSSSISGSTVARAGGGGGSSSRGGGTGQAGGGNGANGSGTGNNPGGSANANSGSGGGAGRGTVGAIGGNGGSGIVIIRYAI